MTIFAASGFEPTSQMNGKTKDPESPGPDSFRQTLSLHRLTLGRPRGLSTREKRLYHYITYVKSACALTAKQTSSSRNIIPRDAIICSYSENAKGRVLLSSTRAADGTAVVLKWRWGVSRLERGTSRMEWWKPWFRSSRHDTMGGDGKRKTQGVPGPWSRLGPLLLGHLGLSTGREGVF